MTLGALRAARMAPTDSRGYRSSRDIDAPRVAARVTLLRPRIIAIIRNSNLVSRK